MNNHSQPGSGAGARLRSLSSRTFLVKKLDSWPGYIVAGLIAAGLGSLVAYNLLAGLAVVGAMIGLLVTIVCMANAKIGLYLIAAFSFYASLLSRFFMRGEMPIGAMFDLLVLITFLGLVTSKPFIKQEFKSFFRNPLVIFMLFTLFYNAIQFLNPNATSISTNLLALRKFVGYLMLMFIAYAIFDSYEKARHYVFYLCVIATISALYGCLQQMHGYFDFEMQLIMADPHSFGLLFVGGEFRKFSTMSDPSSYGILMAICAIFFMIHALSEPKKWLKYVFFVCSIFMVLGMAYSGTRTAYATIVAGVAFFILLNINNRSTRIFGIVISLLFAIVLFGPFYGGKTIARFRTTFSGTKDESYNVRVVARTFIQPYIRSHPIGGGLGTTGFSGGRDHPGHYLANFQPDSSYVKRAAETGWIGLAIICLLYYLTLQAGLTAYFRAASVATKTLAAACTTSLFAFYVAEFAQVAIGGVSDVVVYYPILAIILKLKNYEVDAEKAVT